MSIKRAVFFVAMAVFIGLLFAPALLWSAPATPTGQRLRELADAHGLFLVEDSSEAIGSRHKAGMVGSFGDVAHGRDR